MSLADTRLRRDLLREVAKRPLELSAIDVKVVAAVVYLTGELKPVRGEQFDRRKEMQTIEEIILAFKGVRGLVNDIKVPL